MCHRSRVLELELDAAAVLKGDAHFGATTTATTKSAKHYTTLPNNWLAVYTFLHSRCSGIKANKNVLRVKITHRSLGRPRDE